MKNDASGWNVHFMPAPQDAFRVSEDNMAKRSITAIWIVILAVLNVYDTIPDDDMFKHSNQVFILVAFHILPPVFIFGRVITAPSKSAVFPIAWVTCLVISFFVYTYYITCDGSPSCGFYLFVNVLAFMGGAFLCPSPSMSYLPTRVLRNDHVRSIPASGWGMTLFGNGDNDS